MLHYTVAIAKWNAAGQPRRTDEEIEHILEMHCKPCRWSLNGYCRHKQCGCRVNAKPKPLRNKISMATEHCPINLW